MFYIQLLNITFVIFFIFLFGQVIVLRLPDGGFVRPLFVLFTYRLAIRIPTLCLTTIDTPKLNSPPWLLVSSSPQALFPPVKTLDLMTTYPRNCLMMVQVFVSCRVHDSAGVMWLCYVATARYHDLLWNCWRSFVGFGILKKIIRKKFLCYISFKKCL